MGELMDGEMQSWFSSMRRACCLLSDLSLDRVAFGVHDGLLSCRGLVESIGGRKRYGPFLFVRCG